MCNIQVAPENGSLKSSQINGGGGDVDTASIKHKNNKHNNRKLKVKTAF